MVIISNANGTVLKTFYEDRIYQGSNIANQILLLAPFSSSSQITIAFKLPTGLYTEDFLMTPYDEVPAQYNLNGWLYEIPTAITEKYGQVQFKFKVRTGSATNPIINGYIVEDSEPLSSGWLSLEEGGEPLNPSENTVYQVASDGAYKGKHYFWNGENYIRTNPFIEIESILCSFEVLKNTEQILPDTPTPSIYEQILVALAQLKARMDNGDLSAQELLPYNQTFAYSMGALAQYDGVIYKSLIDENIGNTLEDENYWKKVAIGGGVSDYEELENKPQINSVELIGNKSLNDLGIAGKSYVDTEFDTIDTKFQTIDDNIETINGNITTLSDGVQENAQAIQEINTEIDNISEDISDLENEVSDIQDLIPAQASAQNQLADKNFVNSTVQTTTANFRGNWENWASVPIVAEDYPPDYAGVRTPSTNDYMVVQDASGYIDPQQTLVGTWRFKYTGIWATDGRNGWIPEYQVNETPLTAQQLASLNSGITAQKVAQYDGYESTIADLETGKQDKIDIDNKLNADYVDDTNSTNKFVTVSEKSQITTNQTNITNIQSQYLKNATVSNNTLTITKQDDSTVEFQGGGGTGGVTDVRTASGNSLVSGGIATIPNAAGGRLGLVSTSTGYGTGTLNSGLIYPVKATNAEIDAKAQNYKPIVPNSLDYAVKVGITTNTNTLTDQEKTNARNWLGASSNTIERWI